MKVFVFDLLAYGENLDHLKQGTELPYPLGKAHFKPEVAARALLDSLGLLPLMRAVGGASASVSRNGSPARMVSCALRAAAGFNHSTAFAMR